MADNKSKSNKLEHTRGGPTTRDDALDLGVPMKAGKANEAVGPEDALAVDETTRGDYSRRIGDSHYHPHQAVAIPPDEQEEGGPTVRLVDQRKNQGV